MIVTRPPKEGIICGGEELYKKFFNPDEFSDKLNLGCGRQYMEGFTNLDVSPSVKADVYANIEEPLPFKDNSFNLVYGSHILEHVHNLVGLKAELKRIVKFPGCLCFIVPNYTSPDAWGDDTHVRAFSQFSFFNAYWPGFNTIHIQTFPAMEMQTNEPLEWIAGCLGRKPEEESS